MVDFPALGLKWKLIPFRTFRPEFNGRSPSLCFGPLHGYP
jgi:hypothetical protein